PEHRRRKVSAWGLKLLHDLPLARETPPPPPHPPLNLLPLHRHLPHAPLPNLARRIPRSPHGRHGLQRERPRHLRPSLRPLRRYHLPAAAPRAPHHGVPRA